MTDNGGCYKAFDFRRCLSSISSLKHIFTRPYRPQTNGKAERFIQRALRESAYASLSHSARTTQLLERWTALTTTGTVLMAS